MRLVCLIWLVDLDLQPVLWFGSDCSSAVQAVVYPTSAIEPWVVYLLEGLLGGLLFSKAPQLFAPVVVISSLM